MKKAFRLSLLALMFVCLSAGLRVVSAQTPTPTPTSSPTPDPFVTQITASNANAFVGGISGNGRFVVFESNGDLATLQPGETTRGVNNTDGNREIFLYDYAQRRIFQITNTRVARVNTASPAINPTTATNFSNIDVEVSNNRPVISRDGRWIVFSSNADTPFSFDGDANRTALRADGNQEIFLYRIPDVPAVSDLTRGTTAPFVNLQQNAFTRITNTAASRLPLAGTATTAPFVADDNRMAQINDRGSRIVFVSTRNELTARNPDFNPEIFVWRRTSGTDALTATGAFTQLTNTSGLFTFNDNPSISGDTSSDGGGEDPRSVIAFISNATAIRDASDAAVAVTNADGNAELFVTTFNGATTTTFIQATRTLRTNVADIVNLFNFGQRVSRDGRFVAFESVSTAPGVETSTNQARTAVFVYDVTSGEARTFIQIGPRALGEIGESDVPRFPVFAGNNSRQLVFTSALNFTSAGARVEGGATTGLNPSGFVQIYAVTIPDPLTGAQFFTRLTNIASGQAATQPFVSNTIERIAFSFNAELGGGNGAATGEAAPSSEAFYLNVPPAPPASDTSESTSALSFFTGATERQVVTPTSSASPTPTPTPSAVSGLAPGMIGIVRAPAAEGSVRFAATSVGVCPPRTACEAASELQLRPSLPVELAGVSLSINNAAAGLYFVSPTEIQFVLPPGLAAQTGVNTSRVVININEGGTVRTVRSVLQIVPAQPDIYSTTNGPGGRTVIGNATNPLTIGIGMPEPFTVTTTYVNGSGQTVTEPTLLRVMLTGVRGIPRSAITVRLVRADGTVTDIAPGDQIPRDPMPIDGMPGAFTLDFRLPATLAGAGDVSIIVSVSSGGMTFTSRPVDTASRFRIN